MKIEKVTIRNFKALREVPLELGDFNVVVGANGSGKSSILQALHWILQSGRHPDIEARKSTRDGSTLSEKQATYLPSADYRNAGHSTEYGNKGGTPQLDIDFKAISSDGTQLEAALWLKSARNAGLSIHIPASNEFVRRIRDRNREISAYIPGLAGIPLSEERRSRVIVHRLAAAGDANTVLRNILLLLKDARHNSRDGLTVVQDFASQIIGDLQLNVNFQDDKDAVIYAAFQTGPMREADPKRYKPLELAGIGFLQVIQIFAYLVYFRPLILLVDEPDSHLHPSAQERLVVTLSEAAKEFDTQVILTTHSPSMVRALPSNSRVIWMRDGEVHPRGDTDGRKLMGWGLLDKRILLLTEDTKTNFIRTLISQWPELERVTAIWPLHGSGKLPQAEGLASLQALVGDSMKLLVHRDRDFMMDDEAVAFTRPYLSRNVSVWLTKYSDVEAYWTNETVLSAHWRIDLSEAVRLLNDAVTLASENQEDALVRNKKRNDIRNKLDECKNGSIGNFNDMEVVTAACKDGSQYRILGKTLAEKIRAVAQSGGKNTSRFGKDIPSNLNVPLALDLYDMLVSLLK